jgi:beta-glucosidase
MKQIGLHAYRFSISWPRIFPTGSGSVNNAGLDFYSRLVDELLARGVQPWVTLFHWDLPLELYNQGGWLNRSIADHFENYAAAVVKRLSDRVTNWMTINEPQIFLGPGENEGLQTSNAKKSHAERLRAAHIALLAHGRGVHAIRANAKLKPSVGWAPIGRVKVPATDSPQDHAAAVAATYGIYAKDFWNNAWFADPVFEGHYPADGLRLYAPDLETADGLPVRRMLEDHADLSVIRQPLDFYGINVYDAERIRAGKDGTPEKVPFPPGHAQTAVRWYVIPEALYYGPKLLYERYKVPIVITENGMSSHDWVDCDGRVRDYARVDYTRRYLLEVARAIKDGADVRGYFHWSILDNFEWQNGYKERFGIIHVDYATQKRTLKDSAHWYAKVIATNGATLTEPPTT